MSSLSASALRWTASFHEPSYVDFLIQAFQYWTVDCHCRGPSVAYQQGHGSA